MNRADVLQQFLKDTASHELEVLIDSGVHRHLRFRRPGTYCYGFDVVTYPGHLVISGDMGASVFARLPDMLEFFRESDEAHRRAGGLSINPGYWAEKLVANDGAPKKFERERFRELVLSRFNDFVEGHDLPDWASDLWAEIEGEVLAFDDETTQGAIAAMDRFEPTDERYSAFRFHDAWESASTMEDYTFHFLWRLYAVASAVRLYDEMKAATTAVDAEAVPA